jgi:hypothetical protein
MQKPSFEDVDTGIENIKQSASLSICAKTLKKSMNFLQHATVFFYLTSDLFQRIVMSLGARQ